MHGENLIPQITKRECNILVVLLPVSQAHLSTSHWVLISQLSYVEYFLALYLHANTKADWALHSIFIFQWNFNCVYYYILTIFHYLEFQIPTQSTFKWCHVHCPVPVCSLNGTYSLLPILIIFNSIITITFSQFNRVNISDADIAFWSSKGVLPSLTIDKIRDVARVFVNGKLAGINFNFLIFMKKMLCI